MMLTNATASCAVIKDNLGANTHNYKPILATKKIKTTGGALQTHYNLKAANPKPATIPTNNAITNSAACLPSAQVGGRSNRDKIVPFFRESNTNSLFRPNSRASNISIANNIALNQIAASNNQY